MQDRFKFRVWSIANKKYCHFATMDLSADGLLRVIRPLEQSEYIDDYESRYVIQQCTGLKDKNGKLIYEGDILKINTHFNHLVPDDFNYKYESEKGYSLFKVYYNEEFARYEMKRIKWVKWETEHKRLCNIHTNHIIIGNIYENAELLEECE